MSLDTNLIGACRFLLSHHLRGSSRLTNAVARRIPQFQTYSLEVNGGKLFIDLRNRSAHELLVNPTELSDEHRLMKRCVRAGDVVLDIGANIGVYTVWLSSLIGESGRVFAFEPNPGHRKCLDETVNHLTNTTLVPIALSNETGSIEFFVPENDTMASLRDWTNGENGNVSMVTCQAGTLDVFTEQDGTLPDFIKCDIEGGEFDCFRGGKKTLDRADAPIILFEANINSTKGYGIPISQAMDFLASLKNARYSFYLLKPGAELDKISSIDFGHGNIVAVPASRHDRLQLTNDVS